MTLTVSEILNVQQIHLNCWPIETDRPKFSAKFELIYLENKTISKCLVCGVN